MVSYNVHLLKYLKAHRVTFWIIFSSNARHAPNDQLDRENYASAVRFPSINLNED